MQKENYSQSLVSPLCEINNYVEVTLIKMHIIQRYILIGRSGIEKDFILISIECFRGLRGFSLTKLMNTEIQGLRVRVNI